MCACEREKERENVSKIIERNKKSHKVKDRRIVQRNHETVCLISILLVIAV